MNISSRTPEGEPRRCPVCGQDARVEPSYPNGDATCPHCGSLLLSKNSLVARKGDEKYGRVAAIFITAAFLLWAAVCAYEAAIPLADPRWFAPELFIIAFLTYLLFGRGMANRLGRFIGRLFRRT